MIIATDVKYDEEAGTASAVAGAFRAWEDPVLAADYIADIGAIEEYVPGSFYRRELPCLRAVLAMIAEPVDAIIVDGHVWLGERPGLGHHLWADLGGSCPVIGVAKSRFHTGGAVPVCRGESKRPLYVSAIGMSAEEAVAHVQHMHGPHRMPTLLKAVDELTRGRRPPAATRGEP